MHDDKASQQSKYPFVPRFDANGLLTGIAVDHESKDILMVAFMNQAALDATRETGFAHFYSRSRDALWKKGETSGNTLRVLSIRVDCDQDALVMLCEPAGPACHTGRRSCFYRELHNNHLTEI